MFFARRPNAGFIAGFLESLQRTPFSYTEVGATQRAAPPCFVEDHNRILLGTGTATFDRAIDSIRDWRMFAISWLQIYPQRAPIQPGTPVAVLVSHFGFWSLNPCRIVYGIDEPGRFGFAYGTLAGHSEIGEERFSVELNSQTQEVWYDIFAFSRPRPLIRAARPFARRLQRRFARDSMQAMRSAVVAG